MKLLFFTGFICLTIRLFSQTDSTENIRYTPDFRFHEGVYLNFEQVKHNKPLAKTSIICKAKPNDLDFFDKLAESNTLAFYDNYGVRNEIPIKLVWGFCRKGALYINYDGEFNRIPVIGNICHFVANVSVYEERYNPYNTYNPYYSPYNTYEPNRQVSSELRQFLLDFETGKTFEFTTENMEVILMRDPELYNEFNDLKDRKKNQMRFLYLRKYNEKHPLYLLK